MSLVAEMCCFRHCRQTEWRHGRARGSLYSSLQILHFPQGLSVSDPESLLGGDGEFVTGHDDGLGSPERTSAVCRS